MSMHIKFLKALICGGLLIGVVLIQHHIQASLTNVGAGWFPATSQAQFTASLLPTDTFSPAAVYFCQRLVDREIVQLALPGAEHYSIWLPEGQIHRGVTAEGYGQPLYWVDEVYLDWEQPALMPADLSCTPIPQADRTCVKRELYRQQNEGLFSLGNHCQHIVLNILTKCGGDMPMVVPKVKNWPLFG